MRKPRETDTVRAILQFLALHHIPAWRMNSGAAKIGNRLVRFGSPGMSDILGIHPSRPAHTYGGEIGRFLAIEVKSKFGRLRPAQAAFSQTVSQAGGLYLVVRHVDDVANALGLCPISGAR